MSSEKSFKAIFLAVDNVTKPLQRIQKNFERMDRTFGNFGAAGKAIGVGAIAGLTAISVGVAKVANDFIKYGDNIGTISDKTGIGVEALQRLEYAANLSDVSFESLTGAINKMQKGIGEAMVKGGELAQIFNRMGITQKNYQSLSPDKQFEIVAESLSKIKDPAKQAQVASKIFGKSFAELKPLLNKGRDGIRELFDEANKREILTADEIATAGKFDDVWKRLSRTFQGISFKVISGLVPTISSVVETIENWVLLNKDLIKSELSAWVKKVSDAIQEWVNGGGIERVLEGVKGIYNTFKSIVDSVGGIGNLLKIIAGVVIALNIFGFVASIISLIVPLMAVKGLLVGIFGLVGGLSAPILIAIGIVTALAAAFTYCWMEIEKFGGFSAVIDVIKADFSDMIANVRAWFSELWNNIGAWASTMWNSFYTSALTAVDSVRRAIGVMIDTVTGWFSDLWAKISGGLGAVLGFVGKAINIGGEVAHKITGGGEQSYNTSGLNTGKKGVADINVNIANAPVGTRVEADSKNLGLNTDVGYMTAFAN